MSLRFEVVRDLERMDRQVWNQLASEASPMMEWEYFYAMEKSGSVSKQKGYRPRHLTVYDGDQIVAIAPLYQRDRAWVEFGDGGLIEFLTEMTGIPYHQGIIGTLPFTPIPAYRFLIHPQVDDSYVCNSMLRYIDYLCHSKGLATSRIYFLDPAPHYLHTSLLQQGYVCIRSEHFTWKNNNYQRFEDFLKSFKSSRRTKIRRELRDIRARELDIRMVPGTEAPETYYRMIYDAYIQTWTKYMGPNVRPFLNEDFFLFLERRFRHRTNFSIAQNSDGIAGLALFYSKASKLYGRYWGCFEEVPFLHFATCYYHPIEYAIENGMQMVDPGFGGEHKLHRGFEVVPVFHYIKFHGEKQRRVAYSIIERMRDGSMSFGSFKGRA